MLLRSSKSALVPDRAGRVQQEINQAIGANPIQGHRCQWVVHAGTLTHRTLTGGAPSIMLPQFEDRLGIGCRQIGAG
jgi:hypothetical protein